MCMNPREGWTAEGSNVYVYAVLQALSDAGLVAGCDMTPEAALSKLSYVLAKKEMSQQDKKKVCKHISPPQLPLTLSGSPGCSTNGNLNGLFSVCRC